mgnify:CR=1 FL=1
MYNIDSPQTAEEYLRLVKQLAVITDKAMDSIERDSALSAVSLASLDRIAHNVETIACLRGDSGIYDGTRPHDLTSEHQHEMYAIEERLRGRLLALGYTYPAPRSLSETV